MEGVTAELSRPVQTIEKCLGTQDPDHLELSQAEQVVISRDDHLGTACQGAFKDPVIGGVCFYDRELEIWPYDLRRLRQESEVVNDFRRRKPEFGVVEHPLDLFKERGREQQLVAVLKTGVDDLVGSTAPAESRYEDVRV
jgi:hypothetical protein